MPNRRTVLGAVAGASIPTIRTAAAASATRSAEATTTDETGAQPDLVVRNNADRTGRTVVQLVDGVGRRTVVDEQLAGRTGPADRSSRAVRESLDGGDGAATLVVKQGGETVYRGSIGLSADGPAAYETIYVDVRDTTTLVSRGMVG